MKKSEDTFLGVQQKNDAEYLKKIAETGGHITNLTDQERQAFYDSMHGDAIRMAQSGKVKVINYDFLMEVEKYLKEYREKR